MAVGSKRGQGATFEAYFPAVARVAEVMSTESTRSPNGETVLLVDDVPEQRRLGERILRQLGYDVHVAEHGRAAIRWLEQNRADLLVLDMIMQDDFDGLDTWLAAREVQPELRCVIATGFSETERVREAQKQGAGALVPKPYTREAIALAVKRELQQAAE